MPRSQLAKLGPAWAVAAILLALAVAATSWSLLRQHDPAAAPAAQPAPSGAALFAALTASQSALLHEDLQAIAELVRGLDPAAGDGVAPLKERLEALLRREERAAAAAAPPMVLAQFAAAIDGAAQALARGAAAPADPSSQLASQLAPIAALLAALIALLATPLALLRGSAGGAGAEQHDGDRASRVDHEVRSAVQEMARLRGELTQVRQSMAQASSASERLASVADIVGGRVVETALTIERTAEQTSALPQRILEQAEILSEVSRRGNEAATLLVRLIDDAAERDGLEAARIAKLAEAIETIRTETERCVGGIRPLLSSLEAIAALPATLEATIDRAAVAASDRAAAAGTEAFLTRAEAQLQQVIANALEQAATRCSEAFAAGEASARDALGAAVSSVVAGAQENLASSATEIAAAIEARLAAAATALAERADLRFDTIAERLDAARQPLDALLSEATAATTALAGLKADLAAEAASRPTLIDSLVTGVLAEVQVGMARDLRPLAEALRTALESSRPLADLLPALESAAQRISEGAAGQSAVIARLEDVIGGLAAAEGSAPKPEMLVLLAERMSATVAALAGLRGDFAAVVREFAPALGRIQSLAATIESAAQSSSAAGEALTDAALRLEVASRATEGAARECLASARAPEAVVARSHEPDPDERGTSVTDAILSGLESDQDKSGQDKKTVFAAIRSTLTEIDVVQDAVARLARQAEALAEDVATRRLACLPQPVQKHLPDLLATIDATIDRLHSAATALAYATDGEGVRGAA